MHTITVAHNFETAHRLPTLEGKCTSLHGHSWWAEIALSADGLGGPGIVAEYGQVKDQVRQFIDTHLDHGTMLGADDDLLPTLEQHGKVHVFGRDPYTLYLPWPTVEAVAAMLGRMAEHQFAGETVDGDRLHVSRVRVTETAVNAAEWTP